MQHKVSRQGTDPTDVGAAHQAAARWTGTHRRVAEAGGRALIVGRAYFGLPWQPRTRFDTGKEADRESAAPLTGTTAEWVKRGPRQAGAKALLAAAVSDDGRFLAAGGGDCRVHVWDVRSGQYMQVWAALAPLSGTQSLQGSVLSSGVHLTHVSLKPCAATCCFSAHAVLASSILWAHGRWRPAAGIQLFDLTSACALPAAAVLQRQESACNEGRAFMSIVLIC